MEVITMPFLGPICCVLFLHHSHKHFFGMVLHIIILVNIVYNVV